MVEQTRFLSTLFLCSEFKSENIYSGENVCGNFYLRELSFADRWKNRKNWNPQKFRATRYYIDGECRNKNCLKGRGGNDVQHRKLEKKK